MGAIQPTGKQLKALANHPGDKPFVMINLLKFKETTETGESGREAYNRYGRNIMSLMKEVSGRVTWLGSVDQVFIGTEDDNWDMVMLVEYPSRKAFLTMISDPEYLKIHRDREMALEKSVLLATTSVLSLFKS